jgi:antirestriction protein ArdC
MRADIHPTNGGSMTKAHDIITDHIISTVDEAGDWQPCWQGMYNGMPKNHTTGARYNGGNILTCWVTAMARGYHAQSWASYRQWKAAGAQVMKGEKGTPIIYYGTYEREGEDLIQQFARCSHVFNIEQVEGIDFVEEDFPDTPVERIARCDAWLAERKHRFTLTHDGSCRAFYNRTDDLVNMPKIERFDSVEHYYSTLFHELTHWTGAPHRLERDFARDTETKAKEELIAELGSAFLSSELCIVHATRDDHLSYIKNWLQALKNDKSFIVHAASQASKAVRLLDTLNTQQQLAA